MPGRREIILIVGLALVLNLIPGTILQTIHLRWGLVLSQLLFIAGPVLFAIRRLHLDGRTLLPLRRPGRLFLPATLLGTVALYYLLSVLGAWHERLMPPPEAYRRFFADLFVYRGPADFVLLIVVFAIVPAVCEEILFRGFLLHGLIELVDTPATAILIQAMIFALFHFDLWRLPEILLLGLFLGVLALDSGSLRTAILAHALNNALSIALSAAGHLDDALVREGRLWSVPCALVLLAVALISMHRSATGRLPARML